MERILEDMSRKVGDEWRRIQGKQLEYSVGIVGLGRVGTETYKQMWSVNRVNSIYLFTTDTEKKGQWLKRSYHGRKRIHVKHYNELQYELNNLDIIIITVDKSGYLEKLPNITREETLEYNLDLLETTAKQIKGFKKAVLDVTNPADLAAYIICSHSGIAPEYITALNHIDLTRWRNVMGEVFMAKGLKPELVNEIGVVTIGPHTEEVVPIFTDLGGLPRKEFSFLNEKQYSTLRKEVIDYAKKQFMLGRELGKGTELGTSFAIKEVVEAIIEENRDVSASVFLKPQAIGIEGTLPGLFFGFPTRFKDFMAIPRRDYIAVKDGFDLSRIVEDDFDLCRVVSAYHGLESKIIGLKESGAIPNYVKGGVDISEIPGVKKKKKEKMLKPKYKPFDLETMVVAACGNMIFEWEDLNNPNQKRKRKFDRGIRAFCVGYVDGDKYFFLSHEDGISMLNPLTEEEILFNYKSNRSICSIDLALIDGKQYLFGATADRAFMFDINKPNKALEFPGFSGEANKIEVAEVGGKPYVFVAARGIYQYSLDKMDKPFPVFKIKDEQDVVTDLKVVGRKVYGSNLSRVVCWDIKLPSRLLRESQRVPGTGISCFDITNLRGHDFVFAATYNPEIYRIRLATGEIDDDEYMKKPGNMNGTGKVKVAKIGELKYLLASDKSRIGRTRQAGITIWDVLRPDEPITVLTTNQDHSIRGFEVLKKDG